MTRHSLHPVRRSLLGGGRAQPRTPFAGDAWARVDQVQELGPDGAGHVGCVNALSWSDDGSILLSGSDDKRVCIWTVDTSNPPSGIQAVTRVGRRHRRRSWRFADESDSEDEDAPPAGPGGYPPTISPHPLKLKDTILTGHAANIFSTKFLPHANTPTIVTCSYDTTIRVFEVERLTTEHVGRRAGCLYGLDGPGVRVLRCHRDRTKRIVTEDSPHLFMTVSEDGTVRQHDLRRPHRCRGECPDALFRAPAGVDLYSLSLSPLAPHTFAVAGQTDVAYICDRRKPEHQTPSWGPHTKSAAQVHCVRRLGITNEEWASAGCTHGRGEKHITCVKISPHHPDEVICAFSGHSTALFSLNDSPVDRGAAATKAGGLLPPNSRPRGSPAVPTSGPKRRISQRTSASTSPVERVHVRPRRDSPSGPSGRASLAELLRLPSPPAKGPSAPPVETSGVAAAESSPGQHLAAPDTSDAEMRESDEALPFRDASSCGEASHCGESDEELVLDDFLRRRNEAWAEGNSEPEDDNDDDGEADMDIDMEMDESDRDNDDDDDRDDEVYGRLEFEHTSDEDEDEDVPRGWGFAMRPARASHDEFRSVDLVHPRRMFRGARNVATVKDCNFVGDASDKVCSGSDDGNWFLWDKLTGRLEGIWKGDDDVVNVMEQHPTLPLVAVSGIDYTVKIFAPTSTRPPVSMARMHEADSIISDNNRQNGEMVERAPIEASTLRLLTEILNARQRANPGLSGREHILQLIGEGDDREGRPDCPLQ